MNLNQKEFNFSKNEEKILEFWQKNAIFEKSLRQRKGRKRFRFFEGPPTANGRPGLHHVLARVFKDVICRYKTMQGFLVERKSGWDTHGLPVELEVEKELGIKQKKDIEKFGIDKFNKKCRESIWRYKDEWEKLTQRIGFWLDLKNPYITYKNEYIETLWWIIKKIWQKKLLYQDYRVVPFCPHCGTALSSHEVAMGYKTVVDKTITVKFELVDEPGTYVLAWTTTPWTLPGNVALAVNVNMEYIKFSLKNYPGISNGAYISSKKDFNDYKKEIGENKFEKGVEVKIIEKFDGRKLIGKKYKPLYPDQVPYIIVKADFVSPEEGTGIVHIAPAFGEDDMATAKNNDLPVLVTVDEEGKMLTKDYPWKGKFVKEADLLIINDLKKRDLIFYFEDYEHEYPFCWRCDTPLLYYATKSWFVAMKKLKSQLVKNNQKINWNPSYLKEGRFGQWLNEIRDWNFSRTRYWGTPLPIWICGKCGAESAIGSIEELNDSKTHNNKFYILRHGEATSNAKGVVAGWPEKDNQKSKLTDLGKRQVRKALEKLKNKKIDLIFASDLYRIKETVKLLQEEIKAPVKYAKELREMNYGIFNNAKIEKYRAFFDNPSEKFIKETEGGENFSDVKRRVFNFVLNLNQEFKNKNILIVSHGDPLLLLEGAAKNLNNEEILDTPYIGLSEWREIEIKNFPYDQDGNFDLHRPFIDEVKIQCKKCKGEMCRIEEVADVWFDSGAMPFAQWHYPFENKEKIDKKLAFPADYISEAVDQTRGWFYTLLAISTLLGKGPAYKNVISVGLVLDERGEKMSKSKGNIVNPWEMIQKYSADALRWYFYTINPPGETKRFSGNDLLKTLNRFSLLLFNSFVFYETYGLKVNSKFKIQNSKLKVLDQWILARLSEVISSIEKDMDHYEVDRAAQTIEDFISDLSRWYIRRSRRRFQKPENRKDLEEASLVLVTVFCELIKIIAPFAPFLAETIYQKLKTQASSFPFQESVHLDNWPIAGAQSQKSKVKSQKLLKAMAEIRRIASLALAKRAETGIKVRQPLSALKIQNSKSEIRNNKELLKLLKDEVNVKEIIFDSKIKEEVELDTKITEELKKEGILREFIRLIQEARQDASYQPKDKIFLFISVADQYLRNIFESNLRELKKEVGAKEINFKKEKKYDLEKETQINNQPVWLGLRKI